MTDDPFAQELAVAMSTTAFRTHLTQAIHTAQTEAVFVKSHERLVAVLISPERYDQLMTTLEDLEDIETFTRFAAEDDGQRFTMEEIQAEFGVPGQ